MNSRYKIRIAAVLIAVLALVAAASGDSATAADEADFNLADLIAGAKEEGKMVWYGGVATPDAVGILAAFQEAYPFIDVDEFYAANQARITSRILAEDKASVAVADVFAGGNTVLGFILKKQGLVAKFESPVMDAYPSDLKDAGFWTVYKRSPLIISYNPELVSDADAPQLWADLKDPAYKGKLNYQTSASGFQHIQWYLLKQEFGDNFWPEIMANEPIFTSAQGALQAVLTGTEPVAGMMGSYYVATQKESGAPITALFPVDGVPVADSSIGILVDAPHPNAARLFVHWILSPEGQEAIVPILRDYPALPTAKGPVIPGYPESLAELPKVLNVTDHADFAISSTNFVTEWSGYGG
jgi:iron(III) transport system substrate-binding protein